MLCVNTMPQHVKKWAFEGKILFTTPYHNRETCSFRNTFKPLQMDVSKVRVRKVRRA